MQNALAYFKMFVFFFFFFHYWKHRRFMSDIHCENQVVKRTTESGLPDNWLSLEVFITQTCHTGPPATHKLLLNYLPQALVLMVVSDQLSCESQYLLIDLFNFEGSSLPHDLNFLMDLRILCYIFSLFRFLFIVRTEW